MIDVLTAFVYLWIPLEREFTLLLQTLEYTLKYIKEVKCYR